MFKIPELNRDTTKQLIKTHWNLSDLMLMPDDEVYYHFELSDNDEISGPKKTISNTFIVRVPSLSDLYENVENRKIVCFDLQFRRRELILRLMGTVSHALHVHIPQRINWSDI